MTAEEWGACGDPRAMLDFLRGKASDRKLRLFTCACCRAVWDEAWPGRCRKAVEVAEAYADGVGDKSDLHRARSGACDASQPKPYRHLTNSNGLSVEGWRLRLVGETVHDYTPFLIGRIRWHRADDRLNAAAPVLLRDLFGHLFVSAIDPIWLTDDARALAQAAYDERLLPSGHLDAARLGVLADALEEAGATGEILTHLRSPGPHVRGCWAVDRLLGRE